MSTTPARSTPTRPTCLMLPMTTCSQSCVCLEVSGSLWRHLTGLSVITQPQQLQLQPQQFHREVSQVSYCDNQSTFHSEKPCYCLGDIDTVNYDSFRMTKDRHKQILKVCRNAWVTFHKVRNQPCSCQERYVFISSSEHVRQGPDWSLQPAANQGAVWSEGPVCDAVW